MFKIVLCILSAVLVAECTLPQHIAAQAEKSLGNFLEGRTLGRSSSDCFTFYNPLLNQAATIWSQDHAACLSTADDSRSDVYDMAYAYHKALSTDAAAVSGYIESCDGKNDSMSGLNCYSLMNSLTIPTIYDISNNASDLLDSLRAEINIIDSDCYRCTNISERKYINNCVNVYDAMNNCFIYGLPPTVPPPTTSSTPATSEYVQPADEVRDIAQPAVAATPRRTPALFALKSQEKKNEEIKPMSRTADLVSVFNTWLEQQSKQGVDNV